MITFLPTELWDHLVYVRECIQEVKDMEKARKTKLPDVFWGTATSAFRAFQGRYAGRDMSPDFKRVQLEMHWHVYEAKTFYGAT